MLDTLDAITEQEIREYEEYCRQQEAEFEELCEISNEAFIESMDSEWRWFWHELAEFYDEE